jgi:hypothetical protein
MPQQRFPVYPRAPHKHGQQARIRLDGRQVYLGKHGSPESLRRHEQLRMEWLQRKSIDRATLTIDELAIKFLEHSRTYYVKNGRETDEVACIRAALRFAVKLFGPLKLKAVQQGMVETGLARSTVNAQIKRVRRAFRWAVAGEMIPASIHLLSSRK